MTIARVVLCLAGAAVWLLGVYRWRSAVRYGRTQNQVDGFMAALLAAANLLLALAIFLS